MENNYFSPQFLEACEKTAEAIKHVGAVVRDALCRIAYAMGCLAHDVVAAARRVVTPPKWAHLARYARKKRTREKYQRMISRLFTEALRAVRAT